LPGDGRLNAQALSRERQSQVTGQRRNLRNPNFLLHHLAIGAFTLDIARLEGKLGDGGANAIANHAAGDAKIGQGGLNLMRRGADFSLVWWGGMGIEQQVEGRQLFIPHQRWRGCRLIFL